MVVELYTLAKHLQIIGQMTFVLNKSKKNIPQTYL